MIHRNDLIQISELCPIQFIEPVEYDFYPSQMDYVPIMRFGDNLVQIIISEELFLSGGIFLNAYDRDGNFILSMPFLTYELSDGIYIAETNINRLLGEDIIVFFKIEHNTEVLASSIHYLFEPNYNKDLKKISYKHESNYFYTVFNFSQKEFFISPEKTYLEDDIIRSVKFVRNNETIDVIFYFGYNIGLIPNFIFKIKDDELGGLEEYLITNDMIGGGSYSIQIPLGQYYTIGGNPYYKRTFKNIRMEAYSNLGEIISLTDEFDVFNTDTDFTKENKFSIQLECGFIPMDNRDEIMVEDYMEQDMVNDTLYGEVYEVIPLTIGDGKGIPNWLRKKVSRALMCTDFYIDDIQYERIDGAKIEKVDDTYKGLAIYKVDLQRKINYLQVSQHDDNRIFNFTFNHTFN